MLVVIALVLGVVVGHARGGRLGLLITHQPTRARLLLTALGLYVVGVLASWAWEPLLAVMSALSGLTLAYFAWVNRELDGARLVALGLSTNAIVLLANGAVPVSTSAALRAGLTGIAFDERHVGTAEATLPWLGKVIPVAFPPLPQVVSPGDVAIAAGLGLVATFGMTRRQSKYAAGRDATDPPNMVEEQTALSA